MDCLSLQILELDANKLVAAAGPQAERVGFLEYIQRNVALYEFRTGLHLSTKAATSYIRTELATALRKSPYNVNMLIAGHDSDGPSLYFMDYLASSVKVNYGAHGYAGFFVSSLMDSRWRPGMSLDEGIDLAKACMKEIRTRMVVGHPHFKLKIVDKDGIRELPIDTPLPHVAGFPAGATAASSGIVV
jgi:20S proteasome subunit beta 4